MFSKLNNRFYFSIIFLDDKFLHSIADQNLPSYTSDMDIQAADMSGVGEGDRQCDNHWSLMKQCHGLNVQRMGK